MPRLLLVNPRFRPSFWSMTWAYERVFTRAKYPVAPLGLASVAALTPGHWEVEIVDENVEEIDWDRPADVVGVAGMTSQYVRQRQILERFRGQGRHVVAGGNHASLCPEDYEGIADTVVSGEAEYTWPRFCRDFEEGHPDPLYRENGDVDLEDSPTPRFDLLKLDRYTMAGVQFSRGCPFRCEFCDIIVVFGRRPRTKSARQIEIELDALREQGAHNVFFVDDNFIGHKPKAKELLRALVEYRRSHGHDLYFGTEASLNVAEDPELLQLFRDAGFGFLFIGIESPNEESLRETMKLQNTRLDLLEAVQRIQAKGIAVQGGFIVGFDSDDETIFDRQFRFIQQAGIYIPMVGLLVALPKTPLWTRLETEGRLWLRTGSVVGDLMAGGEGTNSAPQTNIVPAGMSYRGLVEGYAALMRRLFGERAIFQRLRNHMETMVDPLPKHFVDSGVESGFLRKFFFHTIVLGGPVRWYYFLRSLAFVGGDPDRFWALMDFWGHSMPLKAFADRTFRRRDVARQLAADEAALAASRTPAHAGAEAAVTPSDSASATA